MDEFGQETLSAPQPAINRLDCTHPRRGVRPSAESCLSQVDAEEIQVA